MFPPAAWLARENGKKRLDIPLRFEVLKKAVRRSGEDAQTSLIEVG
jgi:hypothetical protein